MKSKGSIICYLALALGLFLSESLQAQVIVDSTAIDPATVGPLVPDTVTTRPFVVDSTLLVKKDTVKYWKHTGLATLNFNQISLSNWQGGGINSIAASGRIKMDFAYKREKASWLNQADLGFGMVRQGVGRDIPFVKNEDFLRLLSKYDYKYRDNFNYTASMDFQTTFAPGITYAPNAAGVLERQSVISRFMAPGYLLASVGMELKPSKAFYVMVSPATCKATYVLDDSLSSVGAFGVDSGSRSRYEVGAQIKSILNWKVSSTISIQNDLTLFGNYRDMRAIDISEMAALVITASNWLTVNLSVNVLYDQDIAIKRMEDGIERTGPVAQFKQVFAFGLQYNFLK